MGANTTSSRTQSKSSENTKLDNPGQAAALPASVQAASKKPVQRRKTNKNSADKANEDSDDESGPSASKRPRLDLVRDEIEVDEEAPLVEEIMEMTQPTQPTPSKGARRTAASDRARANIASKKGKDDEQSRDNSEIVL